MILFLLVICYCTPTLLKTAEKPTVIWFSTQNYFESTVGSNVKNWTTNSTNSYFSSLPILLSTIFIRLTDRSGLSRTPPYTTQPLNLSKPFIGASTKKSISRKRSKRLKKRLKQPRKPRRPFRSVPTKLSSMTRRPRRPNCSPCLSTSGWVSHFFFNSLIASEWIREIVFFHLILR